MSDHRPTPEQREKALRQMRLGLIGILGALPVVLYRDGHKMAALLLLVPLAFGGLMFGYVLFRRRFQPQRSAVDGTEASDVDAPLTVPQKLVLWGVIAAGTAIAAWLAR